MSIDVLHWVWNNSKAQKSARLVLLAIADYCSGDEGTGAWPSIKTLARKCNMSERMVHYAVRELVELGELEVRLNAGPSGVNMYRVLMSQGADFAPPSTDFAPPPVQNLHPGGAEFAPRTVIEPKEQTPPSPPLRGGGEPETLDAYVENDFEQGWVETIRPPRKPELGSDEDPGFTAFWSAYPRHVAKQSARKAWRSAVRGGAVPGEIIAGAEQYRDNYYRKAKAIEFTAHPATWLNGKRWLDHREPENADRYRYSTNPYEN